MTLTYRQFQKIVLKQYQKNNSRLIQDSPVYPDVWREFYENKAKLSTYRADVILTPHKKSSAAELCKALLERIPKSKLEAWQMASNGETVVVCVTFFELVAELLPLTKWWKDMVSVQSEKEAAERKWYQLVVKAIVVKAIRTKATEIDDIITALDKQNVKLELFKQTGDKNDIPKLWSVSRNRKAKLALEFSVPCTKADAGRRLFNIDGSDIAWAVLDTGIDARHHVFRKIDPKTKQPFSDDNYMGRANDPNSNKTRVIATYDFTKFRSVLANINRPQHVLFEKDIKGSHNTEKALSKAEKDKILQDVEYAIQNGRLIDWTILAPLLRIPHNKEEYVEPIHSHGTHVAGILGGGFSDPGCKSAITGMCPGIGMYDFRVLDKNGEGDEFNILAALQLIRWMNMREGLRIHGINLSMSLYHDVENYACGQTPICESVNRLVDDGVVVVAAAGNEGQSMFQSADGESSEGFRMLNITDPGNAENVITVGAVHRNRPHTFGVSFFSSKGPTGDGRVKPDLVAPGEKIVSAAVDDGVETMDGTSMAAPHVSGAAALLLAKHRELIGRPRKVKDILCKTATDLGREKYFQGYGLVDVLRAIQSV